MAKFKGLGKFSGTLHGVTHVQSKEGYYVKNKNDIPAARYKEAPEYSAFRKNAALMGLAAQLSKDFRNALGAYAAGVSNSRMYSRMTAVCRRALQYADVNGLSVAEAMATADGKSCFTGFEFNKFCAVSQLISFAVESGADNMPGIRINPGKSVLWPKGATHLEVGYGALRYDFETGGYLLDEGKALQIAVGPVTNVITIVPTIPDGGGAVFLLLRLVFSQEVNGVQYPMAGGAMKIVGTFTNR